MPSALSLVTVALGIIGWILLCLATGTRRWKEDIDYFKGTRVYFGLWQGCFESEGKEYVGYPPQDVICDKDFLRPRLVEPPSWFNAVRSLMLLSCLGTGFGICFFIIALITDNSKKTGSKFWPSALVIFAGGLCALIGLSIFTSHKKASVQFDLAGGEFFAQFWTELGEKAIVQRNEYRIETWLRWSYGVGWGGFAFTFFALITAILSDLTKSV